MSLRLRLALFLVAVFCLGEWLIVRTALEQVKPRYLESMEESLVDASRLLAALLETQLRDHAPDPEPLRTAFAAMRSRAFEAQVYSLRKTQLDLRVYVTDSTGRVVFDSDGTDEGADYSRWLDVSRTLRGEYGARATQTVTGDNESLVLHIAAPIRDGERIVGVLSLGKPTRSINALVVNARRRLILGAVLGGLGLLVALLVAANWVIAPLERLTAYARDVRDGKPAPLPALPGRTLRELGEAFAEMRESLEGKKHVERTTQALAHGIKAPLAAVRGAAELLGEEMPAEERRRFLENLRAESGRIEQIVERLLQLSALEARTALRAPERIEAAALLAEVADGFRSAGRAAGVELIVAAEAGGIVCGERALLREALANLVQNAVEFSPRDGRVTLAARAGGGAVEFAIEDEGSGVPDYALGRIFERFYSLERPATGRKSTGLGLALVREIAHLHRGEAELVNRAGATGARATLRLPAA
ncbi:MAG TPA: two-component system sensor histidine kinase CreC [Opitutaceae bacterium]|nr:two-component system sensor histidine kinase CreC [Opitutaceae bacterium]